MKKIKPGIIVHVDGTSFPGEISTVQLVGSYNRYTFPKTKPELKAGEIVRRWGKKVKKATPGDKAPFGIVVGTLPNEEVEVIW